MATVRDRLWIWGHEAGSHSALNAKGMWGALGPSRITPAEAAYYMGIPNCVMVVYGNRPEPPFDQYTLAMSPLDRIVWSVMGDAGSTRNDEESDLQAVLDAAAKHPNVAGAIMDDFYRGPRARYSVEQLAAIQQPLHAAGLDLWVVLYYNQLDLPARQHLDLCDVVTFWTMPGRELANLESNFAKLLKITQGKRRVLGCYMYNYGEKKPMDISLMEHQCGLGLRWLKEGKIEGIIFLASCICDLKLDAVEWTRDWIARVGTEPVPDLPGTGGAPSGAAERV